MMKQYPKRLNPIPIISSVVEIKFKTSLPRETVFGFLYKELKDLYPKVNKLPILQIPEHIRDNDPNFINQPHYELIKDDGLLSIMIGPNVIDITFNKKNIDYPGWTEYISPEVRTILGAIFNTNEITEVTRYAIRTTDFFEDNIFKYTNLTVLDNETNIAPLQRMQIQRTFEEKGYIHNMLISNNSEININGLKKFGSIIDIDTYIENPGNNFSNEFAEKFEECHQINKELFFDSLKKEYINNQLGAQYE